jgi:small subunit ribosomal protein S6
VIKEYELTVLVHPDLELDIEQPLASLRSLIKDNGGEIVKETNWGKKRLAYTIKKQDFAIYVNFELKLSAASVAKLSSTLNITGELLRYLLVSVDDKTKAKIADVNKRRDESNDNERERNNGKKY